MELHLATPPAGTAGRLLFARHGETDWNAARRIQGATDIPLNAAGRAQAEQLAACVADACPALQRVYTSPLRRAAETARIVAGRLGCTCILLEGLREIDFGDWDGLTWAEAEARDPAAYAHFCRHRRTERPPRGESCAEALDRLLPALRGEIAAQTGDLLFLTHSALLRALQCELDGTPFSEISTAYALRNGELLELPREKFFSAARNQSACCEVLRAD